MIEFNETDKEILKFIYRFGGYTKVENVQNYFNYQYRNAVKRLQRLEEMNYINSFKLGSNSKRYPNIYKVGYKTASLFENRGSYKAKSHKEEYIKRMILLNTFFSKNPSKYYLTEHAEKISYLIESGFNPENFPKKFSNIPHIEEILEMKNENKYIGFYYIDNVYISVESQIKELLKKYDTMILNHSVKFNIIVEDENRQGIFIEFINRKLADNSDYSVSFSPEKGKIKKEFVKLYLAFLTKYQPEIYLKLEKKYNLSGLKEEDIVFKVQKGLENINYNPNKDIIKLVYILNDVDEFKNLIKIELENNNFKYVNELFLSSFTIQLYPEFIEILNQGMIKKSEIIKFNFSICIA